MSLRALVALPLGLAGCAAVVALNDCFASTAIENGGYRLSPTLCVLPDDQREVTEARLVDAIAPVIQPDGDSCWAAGWEMVGRHYGGDVDAAEYSRRLRNQSLWRSDGDAATARLYELLAVRAIPLHRYPTRAASDLFARSRALALSSSVQGLRNALLDNAPVLAIVEDRRGGERTGHLVALESATFVGDGDELRLVDVRGIDPRGGELTTFDCELLSARLHAAMRFDLTTRGELESL